MAVVVETTIGDFTVDLFTEQRPQTCRNFLKLCKIKYYHWNLFHSVQSNFIAQTGDPTSTGKGGESIYGIVLGEKARYYEAEQMPKIKHDRVGLLSMVNCGDNMLGSQFFITLAADQFSLDAEHCVFGEIAEGLEIVLKLNETICDGEHRPYQDIRISRTVILEDPFEDPKGLVIPDMSPEPTKEVLMSDRIGADEVIDDNTGFTMEEITEIQKTKQAQASATVLEIVGDIPDADMAPPENVLFVCKLNPVTNDDDLEIIFSRFGKVIGCEVIRDRQSGDSLQYAFVEFADRKACEDAYFKMDNVLIDDRRIHVDFSQSVAKMRWRGKGKGIKYYDEEEKRENSVRNKNESGRKNHEDRHRERKSESPTRETKERHRYESDYENRKKDEKRKREMHVESKDYKSSKTKDSRSKKDKVKTERGRSREKSRDRSRERNREKRDRKDCDEGQDRKVEKEYREDSKKKKRKDKKYEDSKRHSSGDEKDDRRYNNKRRKSRSRDRSRDRTRDRSDVRHNRNDRGYKHRYHER